MGLDRKVIATVLGLALCALQTGCATVDPTTDYARVRQQVETSTGQAQSYQPGQHDSVGPLVDALLKDGLTADEAVRICLLNNPGLQAAFMEIGVARAELVQSSLLSNPSLGVSLRLPSGGGLANVEADLAQNIVELWQIPVRKRAAGRSLDRTVLEVAARATDLAAEARTAYYNVIGADRRLQIARENSGLTEKVLDLTEIRRDAGAGSELDVNLARGVVLESQLVEQEARLAAASARRSLARVLGLTTDADRLHVADALPEPPPYELAAEALAQLALRERHDARALRAAVLAAEDRLVLEHRRVFPSLELGVALERGQRERAGGGRKLLADTARASIAAGRLTAPEIEPPSARRTHSDFIIGPSLALELPIFDQNQAQIARARFELEQSLRLLEGLEQSIWHDVRGAVDVAQTTWQVARFYRDRVVPQAQRSLDMSRESYHAGKSSILAVLDAERTFLSARDRYAAALQAGAAAAPALERSVGLPMDRLLRAAGGELSREAATQPALAPTAASERSIRTNDGNKP